MSEDYEVEVRYGGAALTRIEQPDQLPEQKPEEFQRFEDLTRKLTQVPKAELDKKRQTA